MGKKVLIIGGVAGGATALTRLRRLDEKAEIILFERGEYISFANCGLPYYIGGTIEDREALIVQKPETLRKKYNADIRIRSEVIKILKDEKKLVIKDLNSGKIYEESYDFLIISTGSTPIKPPIPGIDSPNIFSMWNIPDTDKIKNFVDNYKPKRAIVVGGGFIGLEMAENLHSLGMTVSIVEMLDQVMAPIDFEMAEIIHEHLENKGVDLHLNDGVSKFEYKDGVNTITLQSGTKVEGELVILSIGIRPNGELAKDSGLKQNQRGGIIVDKYLKTSDDSIYAIGDVIEVEDFINKVQTMVPLAGPANKQGRIVANNILGEYKEEYKGTQGTSIAKVFDLSVGSTGSNEKTLNRLGKEYKKDYLISLIHVNSHAGYYPGALPLSIKLIYDLDGKVLGSQIIGYDGVDKRIDVIATAIRFGGSVDDLTDLELAYAPPYSSAKDPVNMIGFAANNLLKGITEQVLWRDLDNLKVEDTIFLDIREDIERTVGSIPNSISIPLRELRDRVGELDKDKLIVPYCSIGLRGYIADRVLRQKGFKSMNLAGGFNTYKTLYMKNNSNSEDRISKTFSDSGEVESTSTEYIKLNACGLSCPGPIIQVSEKMKTLLDGELLEVSVTDPGFINDIKAWCKNTDNTLISDKKEDKKWVVVIKKGLGGKDVRIAENSIPKKGKTIVVFSGELDKAIASFIIANGARSMGDEVNMFFTFWGLNILRKNERINVKKDIIANMFSKMMPRGSMKLGISKMNMGGMGGKMIRMVMKNKNISSLEDLMIQAMKSGIKLTACQMSMDVMGITKDELIDGVEIGGVAMMLSDANESSASFFI
jgi:NADPH-dependent 2,4-dienoyl-CoA reductase/sulfur reductase-like enzyme/peroxiredoxin family protein/TusA-related sulfurtransferase/rhodanese-related sulfurtransferase